MTVRIRVLGATEVSIGHRRIGMNTEVLFALALYLSTRAGERVPRDELVDRFWPNGELDDRRHALRQMLYRLRQKGVPLDDEGEWVTIDESRVDSDLRSALAENWPEKASPEEIDAAATFTPSFSRRISPAFLEWLDEVRERLAAQHRRAALKQIYTARREARWADLERWALPILRTDPLNEEATLARAESAAMVGSKTIALEILDNYLQEVGDISPELGRPAAQLRKRLAERRPDWSTRGPKEVPLVGRTELMSRLTGLVEAAWRGEGGAVVLVGAPGIGKTRLAMEARAYAELKGMRTVVLRAEVGNSERPLAVAQELMRALLELPGAAGCDPADLLLLRRIVANTLVSDSESILADSNGPARLVNATVELLRCVLHEIRLFVTVDDAHNVDAASLRILRSLVVSSAEGRASWMLTSRASASVDVWGGSARYTLQQIKVGRLSRSESCELARKTASAHERTLGRARETAVAEAAGGNPLFVRELSIANGEGAVRERLPESIRQVVADRLSRLSGNHVRIIRVVALLGADATPSRVRMVSQIDLPALTDAIEYLEGEGVIRVASTNAFELHDCWREYVLDALEGATLCALSYECALVLSDEDDFARSAHSIWRAAELFEQAGETSRAIRHYAEASDRLYSSGMAREAAEVLLRCDLTLVESGLRVALAAKLARALLASGDPEKCIEVSEESTRGFKPASVEDLDSAARLLSLRAQALVKLGRAPFDELARLASYAGDGRLGSATRQSVALTGIRLASNMQERDLEVQFYTASEDVCRSTGPTTLGALVGLVYHSENGTAAQLERCQQILRSADPFERSAQAHCTMLRWLCHSLRIVGRVNDALEVGQKAFQIAISRALPDDAVTTATVLCYVSLDFELLDEAGRWLQEAKRDARGIRYPQLATLVGHAESRVLLQCGRFPEARRQLLDREASIRDNPIRLSRCTEQVTLAWLHAACGDAQSASSAFDRCVEDIERLSSLQVGDYVVEMGVRTLKALGRIHHATELATRHLESRHRRFRRPVLPFYRELDRHDADSLSSAS